MGISLAGLMLVGKERGFKGGYDWFGGVLFRVLDVVCGYADGFLGELGKERACEVYFCHGGRWVRCAGPEGGRGSMEVEVRW